jgi:hypothetical protein
MSNCKQNFLEGKSHTTERPLRLRHLFKKPTVRQYNHAGKVYRQAEEHTASSFELFFDLLFAGLVHQFAEAAIEPEPSGANVGKFILVFYVAWSIWNECAHLASAASANKLTVTTSTRQFINQSGTDDLIQRFLILFTMLVLTGYASNASAIELERNEEGHMGFTALSKSAIRAATAFLFVACGIRMVRQWIFAAFLPRFRPHLLIQSTICILCIAITMPVRSSSSFDASKSVAALLHPVDPRCGRPAVHYVRARVPGAVRRVVRFDAGPQEERQGSREDVSAGYQY